MKNLIILAISIGLFSFAGYRYASAVTDPAQQLTGTATKLAPYLTLHTFPNGLRCVTYNAQGIDCDWKNATR